MGVRMPERPVETYHRTLKVGGHTGTAVEIKEALGELELALPVTPDEIRQKYRGLVRQLHPHLNPGNAAYETLTGVSYDALQDKESAEDLLTSSATVTFTTGGGLLRTWRHSVAGDFPRAGPTHQWFR